jgi:hypothetical protein
VRVVEFHRVRLEDVERYEDRGWRVTERDGAVPFSMYSSGHGEETLVRRELADFGDALRWSMSRG